MHGGLLGRVRTHTGGRRRVGAKTRLGLTLPYTAWRRQRLEERIRRSSRRRAADTGANAEPRTRLVRRACAVARRVGARCQRWRPVAASGAAVAASACAAGRPARARYPRGPGAYAV